MQEEAWISRYILVGSGQNHRWWISLMRIFLNNNLINGLLINLAYINIYIWCFFFGQIYDAHVRRIFTYFRTKIWIRYVAQFVFLCNILIIEEIFSSCLINDVFKGFWSVQWIERRDYQSIISYIYII